MIDKIYDTKGNLRAEMQPLVARQNAPQVIDPRNAYVMTSMLQDVVRIGTARAALGLGRSDIAGKTGTTNENKDVWFAGYNPKVVTVVYLGFDTPRSLGRRAFGGTVALPVWMDYMRFALKGMPIQSYKAPTGVVKKNKEVFLQEQQNTTVAVDNSTSDPDAVKRSAQQPEPQSEGGAEEDEASKGIFDNLF